MEEARCVNIIVKANDRGGWNFQVLQEVLRSTKRNQGGIKLDLFSNNDTRPDSIDFGQKVLSRYI